MASFWACPRMSVPTLSWRARKRKQKWPSRVEQRKGDLSHPASNPLPNVAEDTAVFSAARTRLWLMVNRCPPGASLQSCSSAELQWCLASFLPGAGLGLCLCWSSGGSYWPLFPACQSSSELKDNYLVHQLNLIL